MLTRSAALPTGWTEKRDDLGVYYAHKPSQRWCRMHPLSIDPFMVRELELLPDDTSAVESSARAASAPAGADDGLSYRDTIEARVTRQRMVEQVQEETARSCRISHRSDSEEPVGPLESARL